MSVCVRRWTLERGQVLHSTLRVLCECPALVLISLSLSRSLLAHPHVAVATNLAQDTEMREMREMRE